MSEQYVRDYKDNDALPDLWAVSYYAAYLEAHVVTPEQVNGAPAASVTGVAYYLDPPPPRQRPYGPVDRPRTTHLGASKCISPTAARGWI